MIGSFVGVILVATAKLITTDDVIDPEDISESLAEGTAEEETPKVIVT